MEIISFFTVNLRMITDLFQSWAEIYIIHH